MTTEQNNLESVIDQEQQNMDREQGLESSQESLNMTQVQALLDQQRAEFQRSIDSSRSHYDRGLNAIRRDAMGWAQDAVKGLQNDLGQKQWWDSLDEDDREKLGPLYERLKQLEGTPSSDQYTEIPAPQESPPSNPDAQWQQVYNVVKSFGLDPQNQTIRYSVLTDTNLQPQQRQDEFLRSLREAVAQQAIGESRPTQAQQPAAQNSVNPPVENPGRGDASSLRTADDVRDAYISNQLTHEQYRERMTSLGEQY